MRGGRLIETENKLSEGKKIFIIDTNVLLYSADALMAFEDNTVIIADVVLNELDKYKTSTGDIGFNAREVARQLNKFKCDTDNGDLISGYKLPNNGYMKLEQAGFKEPVDDALIDLAIKIKKDVGDKSVIIVSNDTFLRLKALLSGIEAEEFLNQSIPKNNEEYTGRGELFTDTNTIDAIYSHPKLNKAFEEHYFTDIHGEKQTKAINNQYFVIKAVDSQSSVIALYNKGYMAKVPKSKVYNINPITAGQTMAINALVDDVDKTPLAIIRGPAGTGKTLLAIAAGLEAVERGDFNKVLYLRANTVLDDEIGFLPGTEEEKLEWLIRPVKDNLEVLIKNQNSNLKYTDITKKVQEMFDKGIIKVESVGFMRGRSLNDMFIVIDEAQNLTPQQVKTLLSRAGKNTKVVLLGDPEQIDKPYLDYGNNGLTFACDRLKGSPLVKQVKMFNHESERSPLSFEIIEKLK